jgi:hypothetical protein
MLHSRGSPVRIDKELLVSRGFRKLSEQLGNKPCREWKASTGDFLVG